MAKVRRTSAEVGAEVRRMRKERKLTQGGLGMKVNADQSTVSRLESGDSVIDVMLLMNICDVFGITINDLCYATTEDEKEKDVMEADRIIRNIDFNTRAVAMRMLRSLG